MIAAQPLIWQDESLILSCSVGIHQFSGQQNADEALSRADADMYDEKRRYYAELNKQRQIPQRRNRRGQCDNYVCRTVENGNWRHPGQVSMYFTSPRHLPSITELHDYWQCRRAGAMPSRVDIDPADIRHLLPAVALVDIEAGRSGCAIAW